MKFQFLCRLLTVGTLLAALTGACSANEYFVRVSGDDDNSGRSASLAFRTLEKALSVVSGPSRVYIGAGEYSAKVSESFPTNTTLEIIGDKEGSYTGDAGEVCLLSATGHYALSLVDLRSVAISGLKFKSQLPQSNGRGCRIQRIDNEVVIHDCVFEDVYLAIYATHVQTFKLVSSRFDDADYGAYSNYCAEIALDNVEFESFVRGLYAYNVKQTTISDVTTGQRNLDTKSQYPIAIYAGDVKVSGCSFNEAIWAITTSGVGAFVVDSTKISNSTYGISARAESFACHNCYIEGKSAQSGRGIDVYGEIEPELKSCSLVNLHTGLYLDGPPALAASDVSVKETSYGLRFGPNSNDIKLDLSGFSLEKNRYGVTATTSRAGKYFHLANFKSEANDYAVVTTGGAFSMEKCTIAGCRYGAIHYSGEKTQIQNCEIRPNDATSTMGLMLYSPNTKIDGVLVQGGYEGMRIYMPDATATTYITNTKLLDSTYRGLYLQNGTTKLTGKHNLVISGSRHGITTSDAHVEIDGFVPDADYCFSFTRGTASVANVKASGGIRFLYSSTQDALKVSSVSTEAFTDRAYYVVNTRNVSLDGLVASSNRNAITCYYADNVRLSNLSLSDNTSYSVFLHNTIPPTSHSVTNVQVTGSTYGYRSVQYPFSPEVISKLSVKDANHAVRVEQADAVVATQDQLDVSGNRYALLCYNGTLRCEDVEIDESNQIGVYASNSPVTIDGCKIRSSLYGALLYSPNSIIRDSYFDTAKYAVYFAPFSTVDDSPYDLQLEGCTIAKSSIGAYLIGRSGLRPRISITKSSMHGMSSGVISSNCDLDVQSLSIDESTSVGFRTTDCDSWVRGLAISNCNSWGTYCLRGQLVLEGSRVHSRWGVYLASENSKVVNSLIRDSYYGVYHRAGQSHLFHTTIGNVSGMGVYQLDGDMEMRNCIVDSRRYGIYKRSSSLKSEHDYNLIRGDLSSFYNDSPAMNEIEKHPIFVSAATGDLHLAAGSPAINAGEDLSVVTSIDLEGNKRPSFRRFEMGAYEYTKAAGSLRVLKWNEIAQ